MTGGGGCYRIFIRVGSALRVFDLRGVGSPEEAAERAQRAADRLAPRTPAEHNMTAAWKMLSLGEAAEGLPPSP